MPAIQGLRGTGEFTVDFRPKNYRELFTLLEPNGSAPLNALLSMTSSEETNDPEFKHFRDELPPRTVQVNGALNNSATTVVIDADTTNNPFIVPGVIITNPATGENMRVTAFNGTTSITVVRGVGSTAANIADDSVLAIVGFADVEGGVSPTAISFESTVDYNYTQIFKTAIQLTGTLKNTYLRTGPKEQEQLTKALKMHMSDIERAFFFGTRSETNGSTAQPLRTTGGLLSMIPNVIDASSNPYSNGAGVITEKAFDRALVENIFQFGSTEKVAFCGPRVVAHFQEMGKNRWQPTQVAGSYGVSMTRYSTFTGDLLVNLHPMFRQIPALNNAMVIVDMNHLKYKYMKGRDTMLQKDIQNNDVDGVKHQYLTECGLELTQGKVHTVIKNWNSIIATS